MFEKIEVKKHYSYWTDSEFKPRKTIRIGSRRSIFTYMDAIEAVIIEYEKRNIDPIKGILGYLKYRASYLGNNLIVADLDSIIMNPLLKKYRDNFIKIYNVYKLLG